ncbi:hypothetical protein [Desulfovibrio oxyclinae]|uniref:hypothetical protein n=1 Tax=Desulfovibrio oxyclinae TaxID=63560 RepID=UPI000362CD69|nr:hypothetical protein [Desulfovibrio oxyclinae]
MSVPHIQFQILRHLAASWITSYGIHDFRREAERQQKPIASAELAKWLSFYRNHRRLTDGIFRSFGLNDLGPFDKPYGSASLPDGFRMQDFHDQSAKRVEPELTAEGQFSIELAFMALVWVPCIALYGDYPPNLLRKARHGDLDTICRLIVVDKSVVAEPRIAQWVLEWSLAIDRPKLEQIGKAFQTDLPKLTPKQCKITWAQFVDSMAVRMGYPINIPEIRGIFDSLAQEEGLGPHDLDLAEMTDDALYRAIRKRPKPLKDLP